jgi:glyoxylase I family protein
MIIFYASLGFDLEARYDLAPAPVVVALLRNRSHAGIELTAHTASVPADHPGDPVKAAARQGPHHFALKVGDLEATVTAALEAGAAPMTAPQPNSRGTARFAYITDPEGNLIELISPL